MVLGASEDKTYRGAFIASPTMAWVWGQLPGYNGPYHLVWSRDLYEMATAEIAAGYRPAAARALNYLWTRQQEPNGCFPQNSNVNGTPVWTGLQLDEVADPILLASQLGQTDANTWSHVQRAVGCILANGPVTQERWENEIGYSPSSIAAEIAGLICAAQIAQDNGDAAAASQYRAVADDWRSQLDHWTVTTNGPLSSSPYFLRLTVDGNANAGTTYTLSDGGPTVDQRTVVDPSFLELVRLGVVRADNPAVLSTLPVVDRELGVNTPNGEFWHRYNHDGYGESLTGGPFGNNDGVGRLWPIFAGERGEYELAAGELSGDVSAGRSAATKRLDAMANTANDGLMLPEQVWDKNPPAGADGRLPGTGTGSATPLGWTHAQFIRLAWSIDAGRPVETPSLVSCRYGGACSTAAP
jgi:glucoamylase